MTELPVTINAIILLLLIVLVGKFIALMKKWIRSLTEWISFPKAKEANETVA